MFHIWGVFMCSLTRGERFEDARKVHNKHGKQTMDEVSAATGVGKSVIQSLEDNDNTRSVGYDKVVNLAKHYGVTTDFLLGLSDDPSPAHSAVDELGLSGDAINWLVELKSEHGSLGLVNDIFLSDEFQLLVETLCDCYNAKLAEFIYHKIYLEHFPNLDDEEATQEQIDSFYSDVGNCELVDFFGKSVAYFLYAQRSLWGRDENSITLASLASSGEGLTISELAEFRAGKHLQFTIKQIKTRAVEQFMKVSGEQLNEWSSLPPF